MQQKVVNINPDHVLNMDQMPIPFFYHNKNTWDEKGVKMVHTQSSNSETKTTTLAPTVTMSGEVLPPVLEQKELPNLPPMCLYAIQKGMDE